MKRLIAVVVCAVVAASAYAAVGQDPTIGEMSRGAGRIVVAQVLDVQSKFAANEFGDQLIISNVVLDVVETLKGPSAATLNMTLEGGTVGDLTLTVSDLPSLQTGDRGMFFLEPSPDGSLVPHQRGQGVLKASAEGRIDGRPDTLDDVKGQVIAALRGNR